MFNLGISELLLIFVAALVFVGPGDLPKVARWLARGLKYLRRTLKDIMTAMNLDEDIQEVRETGKMLRETVHDLNPVSGITDEIESVKKDLKTEFKVIDDMKAGLKSIDGGNILTGNNQKPAETDDIKKEA
ncbi:MAG: twin-arginine translocase TatA/TatE family subunit [Treponema sp.]|nr:twin-arginine translocase TatA/TatE family subunit [Treponema sp.]